MRRAGAWVYVLAAIAWAAWLPLSAALLGAATRSGPAVVAASLTYRAGAIVCHQDPARSFHVGVWPWPVCARCAGLYLGGAAGAVAGAVLLVMTGRRGRWRSGPPLGVVRLALLMAAAPTALLWIAEQGAGLAVPASLRAIGAAPLGAAVSWLVVAVVAGVPLPDAAAAPGVD